MRPLSRIIAATVIGTALAACGDDGASPTTVPAAPDTTTAANGDDETHEDPASGDASTDEPSGQFTNGQPLPDGYPVHPEITFTDDLPVILSNAHAWSFSTTEAADALCAFWVTEYERLGFDVEADCQYADMGGFRQVTAHRNGERATDARWTGSGDDGTRTINIHIYWDNWDDAWLD